MVVFIITAKRLRLPTVRECGALPCPLAKPLPRATSLANPLKPAWFGEPMLAPVYFRKA